MSQIDDIEKQVKKASLRYINDGIAGISRKRVGKGFVYLDSAKKIIKVPAIVERIEKLTIPPAWQNVWICASPNGYLQATGFDDKGRKQYLYHPEWNKQSQENKFHKMRFFGQVLPEIRSKVGSDLNINKLTKEKVLATVVWLLGQTFIRVGNEEYAKENNSFGLTTLRNKHVKVWGKHVSFEFVGKSGVEHSVSLENPKIAQILKECIELPGFELFQYIDEEGNRMPIDSGDVNEYLKSITGDDEISAKYFRTWGGTTLSAAFLNDLGDGKTEEEIKKNITEAVKTVADYLRNTVSVCRNYYIHPSIIESYEHQKLIAHFQKILTSDKGLKGLTKKEYAVWTMLDKYS